MERWIEELEAGDLDAAWDLFLERYRRLIFATIRHFAEDYDDVMDIFAHVCQALREQNLARLRKYTAQTTHRAHFSTWLVTVVRHLVIDWFRQRGGRKRLSTAVAALSPLQQMIFEYVFQRARSHIEAYELIRTRGETDLPFGQFLRELHATYRALSDGRQGRLMRELAGPLPPAEPEPTCDPETPTGDSRERLTQALESLDAADRAAVHLFVVEELSAAEVARIVGWPSAKTVYNRVYRALAAMRVHFERSGIGPGDL
jgi:RNA polymerase sigma factor (sigma-70 family)